MDSVAANLDGEPSLHYCRVDNSGQFDLDRIGDCLSHLSFGLWNESDIRTHDEVIRQHQTIPGDGILEINTVSMTVCKSPKPD